MRKVRSMLIRLVVSNRGISGYGAHYGWVRSPALAPLSRSWPNIESPLVEVETRMAKDAVEELAEVLSEGLDLCVRARGLDEQVQNALQAGMGRIFPEGTRCATPALWVQEQYDTDLATWESKAREIMTRLGFAR